jgi:hypothetical protein
MARARRGSSSWTLTLWLLFGLGACVSSGPNYALPKESGEPVFILSHGGTDTQPLLQFTNDGQVLTRAGKAQINNRRLQDLLHFVLSTERFFDIDTDAVKLAIHQQNSQRGSALAVFNAPTTIMELRLRDRTHRVEVHALEFQATSHANIPSLQRLVAIQRRLIQESGIALMGGEKKLDKLAARATKELRSKYPERAGFTTAELVGVGRRKADGARVVHFRREESATVLSYVIVIVPVNGETTVRLVER